MPPIVKFNTAGVGTAPTFNTIKTIHGTLDTVLTEGLDLVADEGVTVPGHISVVAGDGATGSGVAGGNAYLFGGAGDTNQNGGDVLLHPGAGNGSGVNGRVRISHPVTSTLLTHLYVDTDIEFPTQGVIAVSKAKSGDADGIIKLNANYYTTQGVPTAGTVTMEIRGDAVNWAPLPGTTGGMIWAKDGPTASDNGYGVTILAGGGGGTNRNGGDLWLHPGWSGGGAGVPGRIRISNGDSSNQDAYLYVAAEGVLSISNEKAGNADGTLRFRTWTGDDGSIYTGSPLITPGIAMVANDGIGSAGTAAQVYGGAGDTDFAGGSVFIVAGAGAGTGNGGDVYVDAGGTGTGTAGSVTLGPSDAAAVNIGRAAGNLGFHGAAAVAKQTVTGSRGANAALTSLLSALNTLGLITDSSSA